MKEEITSDEYWALPEVMQSSYRRVSLVYDGNDWVERTLYGSEPVKIKAVYRLNKNNYQSTFGGLGIGLV